MSKFILATIVALISFTDHDTSAQSTCLNPNKNSGVCISIYDCPNLLALLNKQSSQPLASERSFLSQSQCNNGLGQFPHVCCSTQRTESTQRTVAPPTTQPSVLVSPSNGRGNILATRQECGTIPLGRRIYGGNDTGIDEYAWMALFEYVDARGTRSYNCAGSLINNRYILTAAHCVVGLSTGTRLTKIRLGEHDLSKDPDCELDDCADPVIDVSAEEITPHHGFNPSDRNRINDIALIRLNRDVAYTPFIRPICLPSVLNFERSLAGDDVVVAGWGRTLNAKSSAIKQKLNVPVVEHSDCQRQYRTRARITLQELQLCAGGIFSQDSCDGDSGGPLMRLYSSKYVLEGIVSFGYQCGLDGWPAVYTRVSSYENWITSNMRP